MSPITLAKAGTAASPGRPARQNLRRPDRGSQIRRGLAAGGRWIRTSGSARQVDVGTVVNPIGLKGQIHGGVVQGLGQALVSSRRAGVLAAKTSPISDVQTPALNNMPKPNECRYFRPGDRPSGVRTWPIATGDRWFESISLQQRVRRNRWLGNACGAGRCFTAPRLFIWGLSISRAPAAGVGWQRACDVII